MSDYDRAAELMRSVDEFGVTHIVTGDGNLDDDNLAFVEREMEKCNPPATDDERELIRLLKGMPVEDREELWDRFNGCI